LTDQSGLFDRNPALDPQAVLVEQASINAARLADMVGDSLSGLGRGGMITKLRAAKLAARSGTATVIACGREPNVLVRAAAGESLGTFLVPDVSPMLARKRWLAGRLKLRGAVRVDAGAVTVLRSAGRSLLPIGVTAVEGDFSRGDLIACLAPDGQEVARGLVNYGSAETRQIMGRPSAEIEACLGWVDESELIHRDNLVLN
jgi:glutamate 5-kinase